MTWNNNFSTQQQPSCQYLKKLSWLTKLPCLEIQMTLFSKLCVLLDFFTFKEWKNNTSDKRLLARTIEYLTIEYLASFRKQIWLGYIDFHTEECVATAFLGMRGCVVQDLPTYFEDSRSSISANTSQNVN